MTVSDSEVREGYRMTELGELPEEWRACALREVYEFTRRPKTLKIGDDDELPFIPMELIRDDSNSVGGWQFRKGKNIASGTFVSKGDVIIAKITPSFENGKQAILDNLPNSYGYATTEVWAVHPIDEAATAGWLAHYLRLGDVRAQLAGKMEGSTGRQRIPKSALQQLQIPLPPLLEQKKIAAVLQTVQQAKERTEAVIQAARELKKSLLKYLFTYGPVPVDQAEDVELKETEIGEVPEEWHMKAIEDIADVRGGYGFPHAYQGKQSGKFPFYKVSDMNLPGNEQTMGQANNYVDDQTVEELRARPFAAGAVIFPKVGAAVHTNKKRLLTRPSLVDNNVLTVTPRSNSHCEPLFLFFYFLTVNLSDLANPGPLPSINAGRTKEEKVALPSIAEQQTIVAVLQSVEDKINAEEDHKHALEELFNTLLNDLMTAKIRVNDLELGEVDHDEVGR
jgi:type I restriction enzyme S subunit